MSRFLLWAIAFIFMATCAGCGSREVNVTFRSDTLSRALLPAKLDEWKGVATKEVVRAELGAPMMGLPAGGGTQWEYELSDENGKDCWHYRLMFGQKDVLRDWTRERC